MYHNILSTISALLLLAAPATAQRSPEITIFRTWRPPSATVVEGMFRVDSELLGTPDCAYQVELRVKDGEGRQLVRDQWEGRCPLVDGAAAPALETFEFAIVPATYTVEVTVAPQSRPEDRRTGRVSVEGLQSPLLSDLVLANAVGFVDSTNAASWTLRRGDIGIRAASRTVVTGSDPSLSFYLEYYPPEEAPVAGTAWGIVRRRDGRELARVQLARLEATSDPRPIAGTIPVTGLPPGAYQLETILELGDTTVARSASFEVAPTEPVLAAGPGNTSYFHQLTDQAIQEQFAPVVVWLSPAERSTYESLSPTGKREFLLRQFGPAAPDPDDGQVTALEVFLERAAHVSGNFAERTSQATMPAWNTDRGRIWMIRGEPTNQQARPSPQAGSPYEIWFYSQERSYVYLFADETRMGHYRLIYTNDPNEQGVPNWSRIIGPQAVQDMQRLGVIIPRTDGLTTGGQ